jgi:hypothetical protein
MPQLFIQLIMYGSSYMFRHYIAILRERSWCLLRDAQLRSSRYNIVDGRVVFLTWCVNSLQNCDFPGSNDGKH